MTKLGIVIPAYKESKNIAALVREVAQVTGTAPIRVVDDSPDTATIEVLASAAVPRVTVSHRAAKGGRGSAVIEGMRFLFDMGCEIVVEMDADFSHPPRQIPSLVQKLQEDKYDMVIASRYLPESKIENWPRTRLLFSAVSNWLAKRTLRVPVHDYTNGFRAYSLAAIKVVLTHCGKLGSGFIPLSEILVNCYYRGLRIGEVPTHFVNRLRGESSLNAREIKNAFVGLIKIFWLARKLEKEKDGLRKSSAQAQKDYPSSEGGSRND